VDRQRLRLIPLDRLSLFIHLSLDRLPGYCCMLRRRQFPVHQAFAMAINKAQVQTLQHVGVLLDGSVFSRGQLHVASSRCGDLHNIKFCVQNRQIANIVLTEVCQSSSDPSIYRMLLIWHIPLMVYSAFCAEPQWRSARLWLGTLKWKWRMASSAASPHLQVWIAVTNTRST